MKRLLVTSTDLMMIQFLVPHIINLSQNGYEIELACSNVGDRLDEVREVLSPHTSAIHEVRLQRNPLSISNLKGYKDMAKIMSNSRFDIIWTNEPVMGVVTRLAARKLRKQGTKVLYMVHGFHFFHGAPKVNWLLYYPIEKFSAHLADAICTVNEEDYRRANTFNVSRVEYIHGIGINTDRLSPQESRNDIRRELGLSESDFIILSVGELNKNKNQSTIIKALSILQNPKIHYIVCGKGVEEGNLKHLAKKEGLSSNIHFLGYRRDVVDICSSANAYVMPSFREGLPVSSLEAMYCGLPLITSKTRGLVDVNRDGINGYSCKCTDYRDFAEKIQFLFNSSDLCNRIGTQNKSDVLPFTIANTKTEIKKLLDSILSLS